MKRILIIDDDPVFGSIYESLFQGEGYAVDLAADPEDAIERLKATPPDLVLLDLFLRKANGIQVLKFIRSRTPTHALPVIVLSNASTSRLVDAAWRAGADQFLAKDDFDPEQLLEVVRNTLATPHPLAPPPASENASIPSSDPNVQTHSSRDARLLESADPRLSEFKTTLDCLRQEFLSRLRDSERSLRELCDLVVKEEHHDLRLDRLSELWRAFAGIERDASLLGLTRLVCLCDGVCIFLRDLEEEPSCINVVSSQTVSRAIDCLFQIVRGHGSPELETPLNCEILLVDDEVLSRWAIVSSMEMAGLRTVAAEDSRLALSLVEENRFDLILLDWHLPGVNGIELCSKIRESPTNRSTPIIFVTVRADVESRVRCSLSGADDFITKPFLFSELAVRGLLCLLKTKEPT